MSNLRPIIFFHFLLFVGSLLLNLNIFAKKPYFKNSCNFSSDLSSSSSCSACKSMSKSSNYCECQNDCDFQCSNDFVISRTIFIPRSLTPDSGLDLPLGNYQFYHNSPFPEERLFFDFQGSYFHLESRKECELAVYFLPNSRRCINIKQNGNGDVGSLWLDLIAAPGKDFSSTICLAPKRRVDGGFLNFYFDFNNWLAGTWLSIAFAVMHSQQTIGIKEEYIKNPGITPHIKNAIRALNNKTWTAGRFCPNTLTKTGVDDIQFKLGWNYYFCNRDHLGFYFVATAPTGQLTRNRIIFEPIVGHKNGSAGVGFNSDYTLWNRCTRELHWMADLKYRYEFSHLSRRLFDLCYNGPWSRYLLVASPQNPDLPLPGVNFFARRVRASTGSTVDFWTTLHYRYRAINLEVGYDLYWRANEKVCVKKHKSRSLHVGIYDLNGAALGHPTSASEAEITETSSLFGPNYPKSDPFFKTVKTYDLNLASGSRPTALTNTIYGAFSWNSYCYDTPYMLGFIAMYEFAYGNTAFEQWGVQVRTAICF